MRDFKDKTTKLLSSVGEFFLNLFDNLFCSRAEQKPTEKMCVCPCGKGTILLKRSESGEEIEICCDNCKKLYTSEIIPGYYLVPVDIPKYTGYVTGDSFENAPKKDRNPIIENYSVAVLEKALNEMDGITASTKVTGIGVDIVKLHKKMYGSVRLDLVREWIKKSINEYPYYKYGSHEQRVSLLQREKYEREMYEKKIQSLKIPLSFK